ncbi:putative CapK protein [Grimontia indica]|uniref:CapK protein n=1 Tax=Grimontia indica TaxID=1056512 RepID=R1GSQ0_9GAMM|nr:phenylacetate--CoA ligase family protein [Grimontia indica]EOD79084.1 putative CapK protein [Grimontia indica]
MMFKDFLWLILKENIIINFIYKYLAPKFFYGHVFLDVKNLPIINKDYILKIGNKPNTKFSIKGYTSGTTNKPMTVYRSLKSIFLEEYIIKSYMYENGVGISPRIAVLRGDHLFPASHTGPTFWVKTLFTRRLFLSSYHISQANAHLYLEALENFKPEVIMAYPSSISLLAKFAQKLDWKPNWDLACVLTSSELFSKENQQTVAGVFGKVLDHYGQAERVAALQLCEQGNYHIRRDYSHVEVLHNEHGQHIVGTNIYNSAMPLRRYDTNDYVEGFNSHSKCSCGNHSPFVEKILGRDDDYLILPNGTYVGRMDVAFKGVSTIVESQIEQVERDRIIIRYVPKELDNIKTIEHELSNKIQERLGDSIRIEFITMEKVPRTLSGKFRSVLRSEDVFTDI